MINITINEDFTAALLKEPRVMAREVRKGIKEGLNLIARESATTHRYQSRSGSLEKANKVFMDGDFSGELRLMKQTRRGNVPVPYSYAIHEGRPDWKSYKPDRFLYNAAEAKEKEVIEIIEDSINDGIRKSGL